MANCYHCGHKIVLSSLACIFILRMKSSLSTFHSSSSLCICSSHHSFRASSSLAFSFLATSSEFVFSLPFPGSQCISVSHDMFACLVKGSCYEVLEDRGSLSVPRWSQTWSQFSCLRLPSSRITCVCHCALFLPELLGGNHSIQLFFVFPILLPAVQ